MLDNIEHWLDAPVNKGEFIIIFLMLFFGGRIIERRINDIDFKIRRISEWVDRQV